MSCERVRSLSAIDEQTARRRHRRDFQKNSDGDHRAPGVASLRTRGQTDRTRASNTTFGRLKPRYGFPTARSGHMVSACNVSRDPALSQQVCHIRAFFDREGGLRPSYSACRSGIPPYSEAVVATRDKRSPNERASRVSCAHPPKCGELICQSCTGNALIKRDNPQMSDGAAWYSHRKMNE